MQRKHVIKTLKIALVISSLLATLGFAFLAVNQTVISPRGVYAVSVAILFFALLLYVLHFERKKSSARELVLLSLLIAVATLGRAVFFFAPQVKPVSAIVILVGIYFGKESGFFVGVMSMFFSNMLFGQGIHTPWQMLAMGLIGFFAGALFSKRKNKGLAVLYGFLSTLILYGFLMNLSSALFVANELTLYSLLPFLVAGLPWDVVHALATAVFLAVLYTPFARKVERIQTKYGHPNNGKI